MTQEQINTNLRAIGKECFVTYFCLFKHSFSTNTKDIIKQMKEMQQKRNQKLYTYNSYLSRISKARSIIRAKKSRDALINVSNSFLVPEHVRDKARQLAKRYERT